MMKKLMLIVSALILVSACFAETKKEKPLLQEKPKHAIIEEAEKPDCDKKMKEVKEIKPDFKPDSLSLGTGGCSLDEKK